MGSAPQLTDAELVTLAVLQAMLGFTSEAGWLRHARSHLRHLLPYVPKQPGYNKRLRKYAELLRRRETLLDLLAAEPGLVAARPAQTLIGDKNYFGRGFEHE